MPNIIQKKRIIDGNVIFTLKIDDKGRRWRTVSRFNELSAKGKLERIKHYQEILEDLEYKTHSEEFRNLLINRYPLLVERKYKHYLRLITYYLKSPILHKKEQNGAVIIPRELLACMEDKEDDILNNNYIGKTFINAFSRDIAPIKLKKAKNNGEYSQFYKEAKAIEKIEFSNEIFETFDRGIKQLVSNERRVYLISGKAFSRRRQKKYIKDMKVQVLQETSKFELQQELLNYMNGLPSLLFEKIIEKNAPDTLAYIFDMPENTSEEKAKKLQQKRVFCNILDFHIQLYKPTSDSVRIFSINEHLINLKSEARHILTKGWIEADLKSAQLAIAARIWDVPKVIKFLENKGNIWEHLATILGYASYEPIKPYLKNALYAILYGGGKATVMKELEKGIFDVEAYNKLTQNNIIREILKGRNRMIRRIKKERKVYDAFGNLILLDNVHKQNPELSILAQLSQSYEMALLEPIIRRTIEERDKKHGFTLTLWQWDGFSFKPHCKEDGEKWINTLRLLVQSQAEKFQIPTQLEFTGIGYS